MEQITKYNYENYAIDYIEGTLPYNVKIAFDTFLLQNPDIKYEIEPLNTVKLTPKTFYINKDILKRTDINLSVFDDLCISVIESDANNEQIGQLNNILKNDKKLESQFELYKKTKLVAQNITLTNKQLLKKQNFKLNNKVTYYALAIAASVLLLLSLNINLFNHNYKVAGNINEKNNAPKYIHEFYPKPNQNKSIVGKINKKVNTNKMLFKTNNNNKLANINNTINLEIINIQLIKSIGCENIEQKHETYATIIVKPKIEHINSNTPINTVYTRAKEIYSEINKQSVIKSKNIFWLLAYKGVDKINDMAQNKFEINIVNDTINNQLNFRFKNNLFSYYSSGSRN